MMKQIRWLVGLAVVLGCGGPRKPGAIPNDVVYWKVDSSNVDFASCSDDPEFRSQIQPVTFEANSYWVYKVDKDAKHAVTQSCSSFDPKSCTDAQPPLVFDVAGNELSLNMEDKSDIGDGGCKLQTTQSWLAEDKGTNLSLDVSNAMSLVDAPAECDRIENNAKANSPNGLGFQGCVVTYKLGFVHE